MKKTKKRVVTRKALALILALIAILTFTSITSLARDFVRLGPRWGSSFITFSFDNWNSARARTIFTNGAASWNSGTRIDLVRANNISGIDIDIGEGRFNTAWDGFTVSISRNGFFQSSIINLNMNATLTWNNDRALLSVVVHEFGHALGLDDNPGTRTVMNGTTWGANSRFQTFNITAPQTGDRNGINSIY